MGIKIVMGDSQVFMASLIIQPTLIKKIKTLQVDDAQIVRIIGEVQEGKRPEFNVSNDFVLKKEIMEEAHWPHTQCTLVALKCIVTFEKLIGGITWREK